MIFDVHYDTRSTVATSTTVTLASLIGNATYYNSPLLDISDLERAAKNAHVARDRLRMLRPKQVEHAMAIRSATTAPRFAHRPRGKLRAWASLRDKRRAWGFALDKSRI